MATTAVSSPATAAADEVLASLQLGSTLVVTGGSGTHTLRGLLVAAVTADRKRRSDASLSIAEHVVYTNYGPDGDLEAYQEAQSIAGLPSDTAPDSLDSKTLLAGALSLGHLDADGIFAMLKEASR